MGHFQLTFYRLQLTFYFLNKKETRKPPQGAKAEYKKEDYNLVEYCKVEYYK